MDQNQAIVLHRLSLKCDVRLRPPSSAIMLGAGGVGGAALQHGPAGLPPTRLLSPGCLGSVQPCPRPASSLAASRMASRSGSASPPASTRSPQPRVTTAHSPAAHRFRRTASQEQSCSDSSFGPSSVFPGRYSSFIMCDTHGNCCCFKKPFEC